MWLIIVAITFTLSLLKLFGLIEIGWLAVWAPFLTVYGSIILGLLLKMRIEDEES